MKVNLKKIGAVVAGVALVASSLAFAGLMYGNTVLVNSNGVPKVKVVVGQNAMATDGVAAANIAARIASSAYATQAYTASVTGTATPANGTSTCGNTCVITDKSVTLDIQVPGSTSQPGVIETLLGDNVDRTLLDRRNSAATDSQYYATSDTSDFAGPFADGDDDATGLADSSYLNLYKITADTFSPLQSSTVTNPISGDTYTETQALWLSGHSYYESGANEVVFAPSNLVYSVKFNDGSDMGIPGNTKGKSVTGGTDYRSSGLSGALSSYDTAADMVHVSFLGSDWIIEDMNAGTSTSDASDSHVKATSGSYVTLAKEAIPTAVLYANNPNNKNYLEIDGYHFVLNDVQAETSSSSADAIISVTDADGNPVNSKYTSMHVTPSSEAGSDGTTGVTIKGKTYKLHVFSTTKGFSGMSATARMSIFSQELKLENGKHVDDANKLNKLYTVVLGWKNKDAGNYSDTLRSINIYADGATDLIASGNSYLLPGEKLDVLQNPTAWKVGFNGVNLDSTYKADRVGLSFKHYTSSKKIKGDASSETERVKGIGVNTYNYCTVGNYIKVSSGSDSNAFTDGQAKSDSFYVSVGNVTCNNTATGVNNTYSPGSVLISDNTGAHFYIYNGTSGNTFSSGQQAVTYTALSNGETDVARGGISMYYNTTASKTYVAFKIAETVSDSSQQNNYADYMEFRYNDGIGSKTQFESYSNSTTTDASDSKIAYAIEGTLSPNAHLGYSNSTSTEEGFVSMRGSVFNNIGTDSVEFTMAEKLGHALISVTDASANATTAAPGTKEVTLKEGESWPATGTSSGFKVTVKSIQATGTCSAGTSEGAAGSCDTSGMSAVISPGGLATVNAYVPTDYSAYANMVVTDKEVDANTPDVLIAVGGPAVNTVSAKSVTMADLNQTNVLVKEVDSGKKIVVAGYTAADTLNAAKQFIAGMQ